MHAHALDRAPLPVVTPDDRLALTLCIAVIIHAMVVLGVSFAPEPPARLRSEGLEITLVTQREPKPPEHADMLAQANAQGGGDASSAARPATPLTAPLPASTPAVAAASVPASPPAPDTSKLPLEPKPPVPARQAASQAAPKPAPAPAKLVKPTKVAKAPLPPPQTKASAAPAAPATDAPVTPPAPAAPEPQVLPTAAQLITRSFAMASLHAELQQKLDVKAKRPRQKFISASTQEYKYAAYMEAWRAKVERIGNLNYPDEARKRKLSGSLLLDVALKPDGSVLEILVRRSSGQKVLDDAAVRIVELASPFAPFPDEIRHEVDILHVTRTWKFVNTEEFLAQ